MHIKKISQRVEDYLTRPGEQLSRGARFIRFHFELWKFCARRLHENNLLAMSAALSFRTIFAMIPVLILGLLVLKSVGVVEDGKQALRDFLEKSGFAQIVVPESASPEPGLELDDQAAPGPGEPVGESELINVADQIERLVADAEGKLTFQRVGPVGALLLIWTALTLLITLEQSLNRIFEAPRGRAFSRRILLFWSAITLGPVAIVAAVYFSRLGVEVCRGIPAISGLTAVLGWAAPILVGMVVVAMAYSLIPSTNVKFAAAFGGAVVAVPLWLVARWGFAIYVDRFVLQGNLYGVLGVVPLFMLWLNLSWSVFLFGAQLAHTAANLTEFRQQERAARRSLGPSDWLAVMLAVARPYAQGHGPVTFDRVVRQTGLPFDSVRTLLDRLVASGLLCVTDEDSDAGYLLSRPAGQIPLAEILDLADPGGGREAATEGPIRSAVVAALERTRAALHGHTLEDLLSAEEMEGRPSAGALRSEETSAPTGKA